MKERAERWEREKGGGGGGVHALGDCSTHCVPWNEETVITTPTPRNHRGLDESTIHRNSQRPETYIYRGPALLPNHTCRIAPAVDRAESDWRNTRGRGVRRHISDILKKGTSNGIVTRVEQFLAA